MFVMFLYSIRSYVIAIGCVRVPGVPVLVKSGHRTGTPGKRTQPMAMTYGHILYKKLTNVNPRN